MESENNSNHSTLIELDEEDLLHLFRKINIYSSLFVIIIGLIGNSLITYIYLSKKRRTNSSHVYLLCSAINDNLFLIVHLFEDTLRTYLDVYSMNNFLQMINLVDMNNVQCQLINYLRNILRFVSAYIVVAFTLQRLIIVFKPLTTKFKSNKSAWKTVLIIIIISTLLNIWIPFIYKIRNTDNEYQKYCDVNKDYVSEYYYLNMSYIILSIFIPMVVILVCNILIIFKIFKKNSERKLLQASRKIKKRSSSEPHERQSSSIFQIATQIRKKSLKFELKTRKRLNTHEFTTSIHIKSSENSKSVNKISYSPNSSKNTTIQLIVISFSFIALNLPYFFSWSYYYIDEFYRSEQDLRNNFYGYVQITKIFHILNFCIKFYVMFATVSTFRKLFTKYFKFI
jgi:hypothetical protein